MKISFTDQVQIAQEISGLSDATSTLKFKRDINTGGALLMNAMERQYNQKSRTTNIVNQQQYYQLPEDVLRPSQVSVLSGTGSTWQPPMQQVADQQAWLRLNQIPVYGVPQYYYLRGFDEIGLYPIPSYSATNGVTLYFEPKFNNLSIDDFSTGTVTVTNGSQTITNSASNFTASMVGRWFTVTDGTDANWYKISAYVSGTQLTLENYFQGVSGSGKAYKIGQVMDIPEEFLEAPADYAMYRHYLRRREAVLANEFKSLFDAAKDAVKNAYGTTTSDQVIYASRKNRIYNPLIDTPIRNSSWI